MDSSRRATAAEKNKRTGGWRRQLGRRPLHACAPPCAIRVYSPSRRSLASGSRRHSHGIRRPSHAEYRFAREYLRMGNAAAGGPTSDACLTPPPTVPPLASPPPIHTFSGWGRRRNAGPGPPDITQAVPQRGPGPRADPAPAGAGAPRQPGPGPNRAASGSPRRRARRRWPGDGRGPPFGLRRWPAGCYERVRSVLTPRQRLKAGAAGQHRRRRRRPRPPCSCRPHRPSYPVLVRIVCTEPSSCARCALCAE